MRYIRRNGKPPQELIDKAEEVLGLLEAAATHDDRKAIIDQEKNRKVYRAFHDWLLQQSYGKCWFSDTESLSSHFDVEHYRPKKESKDLEGNTREGYWWLAFDWDNLRICGNVINRMKGAYFPLNDETRAATAQTRILCEEVPMLLDPTNEWDAAIVEFNELGNVVPSPDAMELDKRRLKVSVSRYKLNYHRLVQKRKQVWCDCQLLINKCENKIREFNETGSPVCKEQINAAMIRLGELVNYKREQLSSVAVSCLMASGLRWAQRIATQEPADDVH